MSVDIVMQEIELILYWLSIILLRSMRKAVSRHMHKAIVCRHVMFCRSNPYINYIAEQYWEA